jgi:endonuclease/exonuclease/phosphatase family metal-dependent hydrolase
VLRSRSLIRVASYNVHGGVGADGRFDLDRIAAVLAELEADVILLQEVGDHLGRAPTVNQAHALAAARGMRYAAGYTMPGGPWGYGNVVLVRGEVRTSRRFDLSIRGREPRACLRVDVTLEAGPLLTVVAVHLGLAWGERRRQIDQLLGEGGPIAGVEGPLVLGGDFNDWPPGPATRLLGRAFLDAAWPSLDFRGTFPARLPLLRLDRLYSAGPLEVLDYRVHRSPLARIASDHLPIVARYAIGP